MVVPKYLWNPFIRKIDTKIGVELWKRTFSVFCKLKKLSLASSNLVLADLLHPKKKRASNGRFGDSCRENQGKISTKKSFSTTPLLAPRVPLGPWNTPKTG